MNSSIESKLELLGRITEMKRIYNVIETSVKDSACIVVTSGAQGEGKTTVAAGLAVAAAAKNGSRVLAIDYNWYAPSLHKYFGVDTLTNGESIKQSDSIESFVRKTEIENLDILPAVEETGGRSDSTMSDSLGLDILRKAREAYNVVIIDTSSAFPTNQKMVDPVSISKSSDGVVMVALTNVTPRQELKRACTAIETAGAKILGVVANQWQNPIN